MQLHISTAVLMLASLTSTLASASALASSNINSVAHSARDITPRSFFHANQGLFRRATAEDPDLGEFDPACVLKYKCDADSEALLAKCQDGATDIKTGEVDAELSAKCLCKSSAFQTLYGKCSTCYKKGADMRKAIVDSCKENFDLNINISGASAHSSCGGMWSAGAAAIAVAVAAAV